MAAGRPGTEVRRVLDDGAAEVADSGERAGSPYLDLAEARVAAVLGEDPLPHLAAARDEAERMGLAGVAPLVEEAARQVQRPA
jgi:hypothetical protein